MTKHNSITSQSVTDIDPQTEEFRATLVYNFTTGSSRKIRVRHKTLAGLDALLISEAAGAQASESREDADEAVNQGLKVAFGEASENDVLSSWARKGFNKQDIFESYRILKEAMPEIVALGLTNEALAAAFNLEVEAVVDLLELWDYMEANKINFGKGLTIIDGGPG